MAGRVEVKDADQGLVSAVVSTIGVIDKDGDYTLPGAFEDGADLVLSAYQHQSWSGALPVGKGRLRVTGNEAIVDGQFFLDTTHGRDSFLTVKRLAESGLGEWSYGFDILDAEHGEHDGQRVRFLKKLKVHEASPVLIGAGRDTRTLAVKAADDPTEVAIKEFCRFVEIGLAQDLARELAEIKHRVELADQRDRDRRHLLDIRNHLHRRN
jgi:hypothetical protein